MFESLSNLSPMTVWEYYRENIARVNIKKVFNLSKAELDLFKRLKFLSIFFRYKTIANPLAANQIKSDEIKRQLES